MYNIIAYSSIRQTE